MKLERKHLTSGSSMMIALMATNLLNFLFNSILGRHLNFEEFGLVTLIVAFYYISGIFTTALANTIKFKKSQLLAENKEEEAKGFFITTIKKSCYIALAATVIWILLIPTLMTFFKVNEAWFFLSFAPIFIFSTVTYGIVGYFQGGLRYHWAGGVTVTEPLTKLVIAFIVSALGIGYMAYIAIPISLLFSSIIGIVGLLLIHSKLNVGSNELFPKKFYTIGLIASIGSVLFFSLDIILIRHYFSEEIMGQYSLLALIGKMIFFFSTLLNIFTVPLTVRMKSRVDSKQLFLILMGGTAALGLFGWACLGLGGSFFIPLLFGEKARIILPLVSNYTFAIVLFAISAITVSFHLAKQQYIFAIAPVLAAIIFCSLILIRHQDLSAITSNILWTCSILFISLMLGHVYYQKRYGLAHET